MVTEYMGYFKIKGKNLKLKKLEQYFVGFKVYVKVKYDSST